MRHAICVAALFLSGCATLGDSGTCEPFDIAGQVGKTWVRSFKNSGSFGFASGQTTSTREAQRNWRGQPVLASVAASGAALLQAPDGGPVALVSGDVVVTTWDPPPALDLPATVGKSWSRRYKLTQHARKETVQVEETWTFEAMEDVTVPAGTFRTCRLRSVDNLGNENVHWFSPATGIFVKQRLARTDRHVAGAGTRETEVVLQNIRTGVY
jgi:hypothetical protein